MVFKASKIHLLTPSVLALDKSLKHEGSLVNFRACQHPSIIGVKQPLFGSGEHNHPGKLQHPLFEHINTLEKEGVSASVQVLKKPNYFRGLAKS